MVQNTITAVQSVLIVANQLLDLLAVDAFALDDGTFMYDLATLQDLVTNAQGLSWDIASLDAQITSLFGLETAPDNTSDLALAIRQARTYVWQAYSYAMRTQTLIRTVINTVNHIIGVYGTIQSLIGNLQGAQAAGQYEAKMSQILANLQTQSAAFERAQSIEGITVPFAEQALENIDQAILADHPQ